MHHLNLKPVVVISTNTAWNIYNFRAGLVRALISNGFEVVAISPSDAYAERLKDLGCRHVALPMDNNGTNPAKDLLLVFRYFMILRRLRPVAFLGYTVKPNVYGALAAQILGIAVVNNIAGLGATFIRTTHVTRIVKALYKVALARAKHVFFQNPDDKKLFLQLGLVREEISALVPGSGVDLTHYPLSKARAVGERPFTFVLVCRVLRDKGVEEYVAAARTIRSTGANVRFQLLGPTSDSNPNAVPLEDIRQFEREGVIEYLGETDDVKPHLMNADCVVLPSYREGVPRSLLEAAAMARPIVATDVVGCREVVEDGVNGFLCRAKDPQDLAAKMRRMFELTDELRWAMGAAGRRKVENEFDEKLVIQKYLQALTPLVAVRETSVLEISESDDVLSQDERPTVV